MTKFRREFWIAVKWLLTGAILGFIFLKIDWISFRTSLIGIRPAMVAGALFLYAISTLPTSAAMQRILAVFGTRLTFLRVLRTNWCSYFFSFLGDLPGGLARWACFAGPERKVKEATAAILAERYFNVGVVYLIYLAGFYFQSAARFTNSEKRIFFSANLFLGTLLLVILALFFTRMGLRMVTAVGYRFFSKTGFFIKQISSCLTVAQKIPSGRRHWLLSFLSLFVGMVLSLGAFLLLSQAVGIRLGYFNAVWIACFVTLAQMLPVTVYGLGIREGVLIYALSKFGVGIEAALALGCLWFMTSVALGLAGGIWFLLSRNDLKGSS